MRGLACALVCGVVCALAATEARAADDASQTYAVLAIDPDAVADDRPVAAAAGVRAALGKRALAVLDAEQTRARLAKPRGVTGLSLEYVQKLLAQADSADLALDPAGAVANLDRLVADLARDPEITKEKQKLLEDARLRLASRLVAMAGAKETGEAETDEGKRAQAVLVDALQANPSLTLDEARFPPKMRRLLAKATEQFKRIGLGSLVVTSRPPGATVFLEGREVGTTPLKLGRVITQGRYRIWAEMAGTRSVTQTIDIVEATEEMFFDLQFEGALWPDGPGLKPLAQTSIDEDVARKVGRFLDVDALLLVGIAKYDDGEWLYGVRFTVAEGESARRGAIRLDGATSLDAAAETLAGFLGTGEGAVEREPVPKEVLPEASASVSANSAGLPFLSGGNGSGGEGAEPPWVIIGVGAGVAAAVAVGAVVGAVLIATAPRDGQGTATVQVLQ